MTQRIHPKLEEGQVPMGLRLPSAPLGFRRLTVSMLPGRQYRHRRRVRYHAHRVQHLRMQCISHRLMHMRSDNSLDGLERPERTAALHQDCRHRRDPRGRHPVQDPGGVLVLRVAPRHRLGIISSRGVLAHVLPTCRTATSRQSARALMTNLVTFIWTTSGSSLNRRVDGPERQCIHAHLHRQTQTRPRRPTRTRDNLTRGQEE